MNVRGQSDDGRDRGIAVARITMGAGETLKAETGAMAAMSAGVTIEAKMEGGLFKALRRSAIGGVPLHHLVLLCI